MKERLPEAPERVGGVWVVAAWFLWKRGAWGRRRNGRGESPVCGALRGR
jgi:hypothetical protein